MDVDEAKKEVVRLINEWEVQQESAQEATRRAAGLQKIVAGYMEMFPELEEYVGAIVKSLTESQAAPSEQGQPKGAEAVWRILQGLPGELVLVSELVEMLKGRGWLPESDNPANAVRTALERLYANSEETDVVKGTRGNNVAYGYFPDREAPPRGGYEYGEEPF